MTVTIKQVDKDAIWVSSDEDPIGKEVIFTDSEFKSVEEQMFIALADYFDLDLEWDDNPDVDDYEYDDIDDADILLDEFDEYDELEDEYEQN